MKEALIDLILGHERRIKVLVGMLSEARDNLTKERLTAKKSVYEQVVQELKQLIKDEDITG